MGCKGSKHALQYGGCGLPPATRPPEPQRRRTGGPRHSVALRSSTLGTLSLDRGAAAFAAAGLAFDAPAGRGRRGGGPGDDDVEGMMKAGNDVVVVDGGGAGTTAAKLLLGPSPRSFSFGPGWCPTTPPPVVAPLPPKRPKRVVVVPPASIAPRTPNKTPVRDPEEINVWELMKGLDDEEEDEDEETGGGGGGGVHAAAGGVERKAKAQSAPGSPVAVFDPELLDAFRKALDDLTATPLVPDGSVKRDGAGGGGADVVEIKREIQTFPGIVRARVDVFQEKINAKTKLAGAKKTSQPLPLTPPPPPESAGRVVVYLTSLRGIRQTYEDCWSTSAILRGYGVRVDERDLSMHAGFKDELRAALGGGGDGAGGRRLPLLPQVFVDGRHLGGAEEVRRLHEAGELASALGACPAAAPPLCAATKGGGDACCGCCGGVRFVPCGGCSGSCKVFVEDEDGGSGGGRGAFRRCPECNENGLVKCPVC